MNEQRMQFAIGIVTLIAGFALAAIIVWFGEFQFVLEPRKTYYVAFKNAPGIEVKVPVRRAGIRIGEVRDVEYDDERSLVIATIVLDPKFEIRQGDEPTLERGLLGDTYLDIETRFDMQGRPDRPVIPPGTALEGRSPIDPERMFEQATTLIPNSNEALLEVQKTSKAWTDVGERANKILAENEKKINIILEETRDSTERLANTLEAINNVLDPEGQENLKATISNVRKASDDLKPILESSRKTIEQINGTTEQLNDVAKNLKAATKPLAERSESVTKNLDESVRSLNFVLADMKDILHQFRSQDGTLQRLVRDPAIYQNLDDASVLLVNSLAEFDKVLKDLRVFADKIARHPGELGVQGVLTKDSGLKTVDPDSRPRLFHKRPAGAE